MTHRKIFLKYSSIKKGDFFTIFEIKFIYHNQHHGGIILISIYKCLRLENFLIRSYENRRCIHLLCSSYTAHACTHALYNPAKGFFIFFNKKFLSLSVCMGTTFILLFNPCHTCVISMERASCLPLITCILQE